jgi:ribosome-binding factor A
MPSRRVLKAAEAIREVVSTIILMELRDPRIQDVTVTYVEVSPDMRHAKVHVSVMGDDAKQRLSLHGLQSAAGYLQSKIAQRIDTRYTPRLQFVLDQGVKHSIEVSRILSELFPNPGPSGAESDEEVQGADPGEKNAGPENPDSADADDSGLGGAESSQPSPT